MTHPTRDQQRNEDRRPRRLRSASFGLWLVLFWFGLVTGAQAQWRIISQSKSVSLGQGAWQVSKSLDGPSEAELRLVYFDSSRSVLRVVDQSGHKGDTSLETAMRSTNALAGCNGGYFSPEFLPLGLQVASGRRTGSVERSSLLTGLVVVRKGRSYLLWRDEYSELPGITDALQAGPRLVDGGAPVKGLENTKSRSRSFVLTDNGGHLAIGTCRNVTLAALGAILASPKIISELNVERALNLDGGSSSALWWRDAQGTEHYDRGRATVRNFLAVVPKK